jgi:prophage antirepressor-like protein
MSNLINFQFDGNDVQVFKDENGNPWFFGKQICNALEIRNSRDALSRLDTDEKVVGNADTFGGQQSATFISEPGVYHLIFQSRSRRANEFKRWVTHDVLPRIRTTGSYQGQKQLPQTYSEALRELADTWEQKQQLEAQVEIDRPYTDFGRQIESSDGAISITRFAKVLQIQPKRLREMMAEHKLIYKRGGSWLPYQRYIDNDWFEVAELPLNNNRVAYYPVVTGRGQVKIREKLGFDAPQGDLFKGE